MSCRAWTRGRTTLQWRILLSVWGCIAAAAVVLGALADAWAGHGLAEAARREARTHAWYLAGSLSESPTRSEVQTLNGRLRRVIASSETLAIAVYCPAEGIEQLTRVAVQSASDSTLGHFPSTIDPPAEPVVSESASGQPGLHIVTAVAMDGAKLRGVVRLVAQSGTALASGSPRVWLLLLVALFMTVGYWLALGADRFVRASLLRLTRRASALQRADVSNALAAPRSTLPELFAIEGHLDAIANRLLNTDKEHETQIRSLKSRLAERSRMLEQSAQDMQSLEKAKETFLSNLSHEMRTPLTSIMAAEEILSRYADEDPETRREFLEIIQHESVRLLNQIGKLLDLAKLEAKALQLDFAEVDMCRLVENTAAQVFSRKRDRTVALSLTKHTDQALCECDVERIERVLNILVDDAFRGSPHNGTVRVCVFRISDTVKVTVERDAGGTPDANGDLLDEWSPGTPDAGFSVGSPVLGSSITHRLVKAHGGTLHHEVTPQGGALVELCLPALARPTARMDAGPRDYADAPVG
ncbi:MAG: HAMP domain-containing histidine kinase [Planctomycetes bacterium]|nr:HAMP domain-containing histidine kinase [Planctomycetota bacterium]